MKVYYRRDLFWVSWIWLESTLLREDFGSSLDVSRPRLLTVSSELAFSINFLSIFFWKIEYFLLLLIVGVLLYTAPWISLVSLYISCSNWSIILGVIFQHNAEALPICPFVHLGKILVFINDLITYRKQCN